MSNRAMARAALIFVASALLLVAAYLSRDAVAQGRDRSRPTVTATATVVVTPTPIQLESTSDDRKGIAEGFLWFGGIALGLAVVLLIILGWRFYDTAARSAADTGRTPSIIPESAFLSSVQVYGIVDLAPGIQISGPPSVVVEEKAAFTVQTPDGSAPEGEPSWEVDPADAAKLKELQGGKVHITATKEGIFRLHARVTEIVGAEPKELVSSTDVEATAPEEEEEVETGLPFLGAGFGTIIIAILLLTIVGALALMQVLSGEAVATLFGAALGYIFGKGVTGAAADDIETSPRKPKGGATKRKRR
jgi:hypothetical protein